MEMTDIKTRAEAQDKAIAYQQWQSERAISYQELLEWSEYFTELACRFDLADEFSENGLI
jgi:hypothetical protein